METQALLLNADYRPLKVIPWERAIVLVIDEKADLLEGYSDQLIRSLHMTLEWPAVVRLRKFVWQRGRVRFKRANVLSRDAYVCQYCGAQPRGPKGPLIEELTLDHVVPRAHSRNGRVLLPWSGKEVSITCWENIVTSCYDCNMAKRDRTPVQAGMKLRKHPRPPTTVDVLRMSLTRVHIPDEWKSWLPQDSAWRDYWDAELDEG